MARLSEVVDQRRTRARSARLFAAVCAVLGSPSCPWTPPLESAVDAPVTLEAVRARHAPPRVVVRVERVTKPLGGAACGHSPLCLIVLPVLAYEALFPDQHDEAVITEDGVEVYRGAFTTGGDFLQARVTHGGVVRDLRQLRLDRLGRRVVVTVAEGPVGGAQHPVPVLPQVDLVAAYRAALAGEDDGEDRGLLLGEALTWLTDEAAPLVLERLGAADEPDAAKAEVAALLCRATPPLAIEAPAIAVLARAPGPRTAGAVLACAAHGPPSAPRLTDAQAQPFVDAVVVALCVEQGAVPRGVEDAYEAWARQRQEGAAPSAREGARTAIGRCAVPGARGYLALTLGDRPPEDDLRAALEGRYGIDVVRALDTRDDVHRRVIARALEADATGADAVEKAASAAAERDLEPAISVALVRRTVAGFNGFLCADHRARAQALGVLDTARRAHTDLSAARAAAGAARGHGDDEVQAMVEAVRLALGDAIDVAVLVRPLEPRDWPSGVGSVCSTSDVLAYALSLAGCTASDRDALVARGLAACRGLGR